MVQALVGYLITECRKVVGGNYTDRLKTVACIVFKVIYAECNQDHNKEWGLEPEKVVKNRPGKII